MRIPVDGNPRISTQFNVSDSAAKFGRHAGIDYAVPSGTPVFAPASGLVGGYTNGQYHGHVVQIRDDQGNWHRLMHNSKLLVSPGQRVSEGQAVAISGATGQGITGPHVHWDISPTENPSGYPPAFNFLSPAAIMAKANAPAPAASGKWHVGDTVWLHAVPSWSVYPVGVQPVLKNRRGTLAPNKFRNGPNNQPGLTYRIRGISKYPNTVTIQTDTYGPVDIYLDGDASKV